MSLGPCSPWNMGLARIFITVKCILCYSLSTLQSSHLHFISVKPLQFKGQVESTNFSTFSTLVRAYVSCLQCDSSAYNCVRKLVLLQCSSFVNYKVLPKHLACNYVYQSDTIEVLASALSLVSSNFMLQQIAEPVYIFLAAWIDYKVSGCQPAFSALSKNFFSYQKASICHRHLYIILIMAQLSHSGVFMSYVCPRIYCFSEHVPWGLLYRGAIVLKNGKVVARYIRFVDPGTVHTMLWVTQSELCNYVAKLGCPIINIRSCFLQLMLFFLWNVHSTTIILFPIFYISVSGVSSALGILIPQCLIYVKSKTSFYSPLIHYSCERRIFPVEEDICLEKHTVKVAISTGHVMGLPADSSNEESILGRAADDHVGLIIHNADDDAGNRPSGYVSRFGSSLIDLG